MCRSNSSSQVRSGQVRPGQVPVGIIGFVDVVLPTYLPYLGLHYSLPCVYLMYIHVVPFECECGLEYLSTSYLTYLTLPVLGYLPTELEGCLLHAEMSQPPRERERERESSQCSLSISPGIITKTYL